MTDRLSRLLRPKSVAVVGGGAWCRDVIRQLHKIGFRGETWPVHPNKQLVEGLPAYPDIASLPAAPDATFIGVNRETTVSITADLARRGAGGAVCFASGFREALAEDKTSADLQEALLQAAEGMPFLGPNCYGFINAVDRTLLWPDQHGCLPVDRGVAIITQSSNIAINLTMQARGLPVAYVVAAGNQAQTGLAEIGRALLQDDRVTALGLHIEGVGDLRAFEALAQAAHTLGKPILAIKVGKSQQARAATVSHTASLAGEDAGAEALLQRLGIARVDDLPTFIEALKLLHITGGLETIAVATISCSGGEASLAADAGVGCGVIFPSLKPRQRDALRAALGPRVALANPLDYNTYIWRDVPAMTDTFAAMADPGLSIVLLIVDFPRADRCDPRAWDCVIEATIAASGRTGARYGMVATLPELMPEKVSTILLEAGVVPFAGLQEAFAACAIARRLTPANDPLLLPNMCLNSKIRSEAEAKSALRKAGLRVPKAISCADETAVVAAAHQIGFPLVLKGADIAHKTDVGAVKLNLQTSEAVGAAAHAMRAPSYLLEEMITDGVAELLIGVVNDPAHGFVLTLGAGGTLTELLQDTTSLLVPASGDAVTQALLGLKIAPLLTGYRGAPPADIPAILRAIQALQDFAIAHQDHLQEIEINPLICTPDDAIAADALLRLSDGEDTYD